MSHQPRIDLREQARNLHRAGNSLGMIVKALGVPKTTVHRWVTSQDGSGVPPPTPLIIPSIPDRPPPGSQFVPAAGIVPSGALTNPSHNQVPIPSDAAWQMPDIYINSTPRSPQPTMIIPYPVEQSQPDSIDQVMLDLFRAKGYEMIKQQYQPPPQIQYQSPPAIIPGLENPLLSDTGLRDHEDKMKKLEADFESLGKKLEKQKQEREEESKQLEALRENFNQFWKKLESKQSETETAKDNTGSTVVDGQNDSKNDPSRLHADNTRGVVVTVPPASQPPPVGAVDTVRPNIPLDLPHKPPLLSTPPPVAQVKVEDIKPEFPQDVESKKQNSVGNGTVLGQLPPSDTSTNNVDKSFTPPLSTQKDEDQKSNGASTEQSNGPGIFQPAPVKPDDTFPQMQPRVSHNLRNQVLTALAIVGIGVAALYIYDPKVRQWIFSQYVRLFHKASPQGTSNGTFTQPQEIANAYTQGYARVNDPNGVAFF